MEKTLKKTINTKKLGKKQKEVLQFLLKNYSIHKTQCTSTGKVDLVVLDNDYNYIVDITEKTLQSLIDRNLLRYQEETMCLQYEATRYFLKSKAKELIKKVFW